MVDALFGSKTRVKLLKLFLNNPDNSYYVREITRLIDEQINSVRRELQNMIKIGIVGSENVDNKLYYAVNRNYPYFAPLQVIFSDEKINLAEKGPSDIIGLPPQLDPEVKYYNKLFEGLSGVRAILVAGKLVSGSASLIDILVIGSVPNTKLKSIIKSVERREGIDINYTVLSTEEFQYRLSVRDRFISEILDSKYIIIKDVSKIITGGKK